MIKSNLLSGAVSSALAAFVLSLVLVSESHARVDAVYSVPTVTPGLSGSASFPTRSDQDAYGSPEKTGRLNFSLPRELTGTDNAFEILRQPDSTWSGTGTDGSVIEGTCGRGTTGQEAKWFTCNVKFTGLVFDAKAREETLATVFGRGFEFGQRSEVARQFEGQPIGVIKVRIRCD
ncbi:hypothetical protein BH10BDE1_BH10BDE1_10300 [soil metagenome]